MGRRVVVRHRLDGGGLTDVLGELLGVEADPQGPGAGAVLVVRSRRGTVRIPLADVVAGKVVPPRPSRPAPPHRALSIADLEEVMALHWLPRDTERLGSWLLRAAAGFTGRGNSVLAVGDPGLPLPDAPAAAAAWYARRGLPPLAAVPAVVEGSGIPGGGADGGQGPDEDAVRAAFEDAGWQVRPGASALVLTAATAPLVAAGALGAGLRLELSPVPDAAWLAAYRYRGQPVPGSGVALLTSAPEQVFARVLDGDRTAAVARGSVAAAWAGVTAVEVDPAHRRRGLARALLAEVARWARERGAASTYLQVADGNTAALELYTSAGFAVHHRYDYLAAPGPG